MIDSGELARRYAYPEGLQRPWVRSSFASTVDGSAVTGKGVSDDLGGDADEQVFTMLRTLCDVILVGAGTTRAEGYAPVGAEEVHGEIRRSLGLAEVPPIAVVSQRLDIPDALLAPGQLVITTEQAASSADVRPAELIVAGQSEIDWPAVLAEFGERGLFRVLCEGGPSLHGTMIEADAIDELCLSIDPMLAAGPGPRIARSPAFAGRRLRLADLLHDDDALLTRWIRADGG